VPLQNTNLFEFTSLANYTFKQRVLIRLADIAFYFCIRTIGSTVKFVVEGAEHLEAATAKDEMPIYVFWHDDIFLSAYYWRKSGIIVMTSQSFDGEYIARFIKRLGFGSIRGSSSRGGARALVDMIKTMRLGHPMAFTIDGPRGPRHIAKAGPILLAKKTGNQIVPFIIEPQKYWTVNSWDKLKIPKPFTTARLIVAEPFRIAHDANDEQMENALTKLQKTLDGLAS